MNARPAGLDDEGCVGVRQDDALEELRERLPTNVHPTVIPLCDRDSRCDGGFVWLPFMINRERAWVFYTLPKKGNWVGVSVRNICTQKRVMRGDFLNERDSPYLQDRSAYAWGWPLDPQQALFNEFENVAIRLYRQSGEFMVEIYGVDHIKLVSTLLDSFSVDPI